MIDQALYEYILANCILTSDFRFGSAEGAVATYIVMFKITDSERPEVLCEEQGDAGRALFQFSAYMGGNDAAPSNAAATVLFLEALKIQVAKIWGYIDNGIEAFRIWNNVTGSVRLLGSGSESLTTWGAMFECELWWEKHPLET